MPKNEVVRNFNRRYAKEYNIFRTMFYMTFLYTVVFRFFDIFYDYKITGKENIPKDRKKGVKYIYAANHVSVLDPTMVAMAAECPIAFMAKKELFTEQEKMRWLIKRLGAFAVDRDKPEIATFKTVRDILTTSWSIGIFPEGRTGTYGKLEDIRKGFATIAKYAKSDIIPIAIAEWTGYPKLKPFTRKHVRISIGKPISHKLSEEEITYEWSKQISEMAEYENMTPIPESYKQKELV